MYQDQVLFIFWWPNSHYINNTEEKNHENYDEAEDSCALVDDLELNRAEKNTKNYLKLSQERK